MDEKCSRHRNGSTLEANTTHSAQTSPSTDFSDSYYRDVSLHGLASSLGSHMVASLLLHALRGAHAEVLEEQGLLDRLKKVGQLTAVLAGELNAAAGLTTHGVRSLRVRSSLPVAGTPAAAAAAAAPYGVVLHPAVPYGPKPRHLIDIYVPAQLYQQQQQQQQVGSLSSSNQAPVVFFCHGGIWASGERWHFSSMATALAQQGLVVAVISYTLYPDVLAGEMAGEVLAALLWTMNNICYYGGNNKEITVMGHSAGGHLGALAVMMLAQHRCQQQQQQGMLSGKSSSTSSQQQQQQHSSVDYLSLPLPQLFIGMSSVYDIKQHFEFEQQRGVAGLSTMARACGGAAFFDTVSPAVMLRRAAAAAAGLPKQRHRVQQHSQHAQQRRQQQQQVQWPSQYALRAAAAGGYTFSPSDHGSPVPGDGAAAAAAAAVRTDTGFFEVDPLRHLKQQQQQQGQQQTRWPQQQQQQQPSQLRGEVYPPAVTVVPPQHVLPACPKPSSSSSSTPAPAPAPSAVYDDATTVLRNFTTSSAAHLPPFIIMNSVGDHMVPWQEGRDMLQALKECEVPAKQLIYDTPLHNDFVLDWNPDISAAADSSSNGNSIDLAAAAAATMPAFAQDIIDLVTGKVQLSFSGSSSSGGGQPGSTWQAAAAVTRLFDGSRVIPDVASKDDSIHLRGPWFALPRSRL